MSIRDSFLQNAAAGLVSASVDPLFSEGPAGHYLGGEANPIKPRTLQRWRQERVGPAWIRVGRLIRYRKSALDAFLLAREFQPMEVD